MVKPRNGKNNRSRKKRERVDLTPRGQSHQKTQGGNFSQCIEYAPVLMVSVNPPYGVVSSAIPYCWHYLLHQTLGHWSWKSVASAGVGVHRRECFWGDAPWKLFPVSSSVVVGIWLLLFVTFGISGTPLLSRSWWPCKGLGNGSLDRSCTNTPSNRFHSLCIDNWWLYTFPARSLGFLHVRIVPIGFLSAPQSLFLHGHPQLRY